MSHVIQIGSRAVGPGQRTLIIAEAGSNHNKSYELAIALIDAAAKAGADAVKFQTFSAKNLYSKYTPKFSYLEGLGHNKDTYQIIEDAEMPREWQKPLMEYAASRGILWLSTPTDREGVDELDALGVPAFKISSYEAIDLPFVEYVASKGKPMIISTGMCTVEEIAAILLRCASKTPAPVAFLQCTSLYPAPYRLTNLSAMNSMREFDFVIDDTASGPSLDVAANALLNQQWHQAWTEAGKGLRVNPIVGLSDHTLGIHIPIAAVALGARIIEKHFTLDRSLPGPDHPHSLEPHELEEMIRQIRDVEAALGDGRKTGPAPEEMEMYQKARRSVVATQDLPAGTTITESMVTTKRPGYGIPARDLRKVYGRVAQRDIREDEVLTWEMVE